MEPAITRNPNHGIVIKCKPEALEGFWHKMALEAGNKELAMEMGVHPTAMSRDKVRILKMATRLLVKFGLPDGAVESAGCVPTVVIQGEEAREAAKALLSMLEFLREPKEKTPNA